MECKICFESIDNNDIITYNINNNINQLDYCIDCLNLLLKNNWYDYIKKLKNMDCEKSLKNMIMSKIPIYFRDSQINNGEEIIEFIYHHQKISGQLESSKSIKDINVLNMQLLNAINQVDYITSISNLLNF